MAAPLRAPSVWLQPTKLTFHAVADVEVIGNRNLAYNGVSVVYADSNMNTLFC